MSAWELARCSNLGCDHEHVRPVRGRQLLPCGRCGEPMIVLPLRIIHGAEQLEPGGFTLADARGTLGWVARDARDRATRIEDPVQRARWQARAEAFTSALEMLATASASQPMMDGVEDRLHELKLGELHVLFNALVLELEHGQGIDRAAIVEMAMEAGR